MITSAMHTVTSATLLERLTATLTTTIVTQTATFAIVQELLAITNMVKAVQIPIAMNVAKKETRPATTLASGEP